MLPLEGHLYNDYKERDSRRAREKPTSPAATARGWLTLRQETGKEQNGGIREGAMVSRQPQTTYYFLYIWTIYIFAGITVKILFIIYAVLVIVRPFDTRMLVISV